jgi:threonylcarbamoyladenosine tRNA methylthiotransferase MtaB
MARSEVICSHLHLPLQSGSDSVLQRMGRRYTAGSFRDLMGRIVTVLPDAFIGADVIAGFPGETEREFSETLRLVEEMPFSDLHVFPYSKRPGTKAADLPGQIDPKTIKERAEALREAAEAKKTAFLKRMVGRTVRVLGQSFDRKSGLLKGLTRNYLQVEYAATGELVNREISVRVEGVEGIEGGRAVGIRV